MSRFSDYFEDLRGWWSERPHIPWRKPEPPIPFHELVTGVFNQNGGEIVANTVKHNALLARLTKETRA